MKHPDIVRQDDTEPDRRQERLKTLQQVRDELTNRIGAWAHIESANQALGDLRDEIDQWLVATRNR